MANAASSLTLYSHKRDFTQTSEPGPEPKGRRGKAAGPIFVVQKHDARSLHWDFRLEHGGVLWSWAVPKGPSMDPADKRLAVHVEDHPLDYASFQGTIPAGNYGAGTVETWDRGTWQMEGDPDAALKRGEVKFTLEGSRLLGAFVLVRMKPRSKEKTENWLLIKERDDLVIPGADAATLEAVPLQPAAKTRAKAKAETPKAEAKPAPEKKPAAMSAAKSKRGTKVTWPEGAVAGPMPAAPKPQLATLSEEIPAGEAWLSEVKFDGYRLLVPVRAGKARLITRNGQDWTDRLPGLAKAIEKQRPPDCLLDGELVALRPDGVSDFAILQKALSESTQSALRFYAFDLLYLDGMDLRRCKLVARKQVLAERLTWSDRFRYSDHHQGQTADMRRQACQLGLEGIICKRADAPYRSGSNTDWLKVKCVGREEFIVLGWTPPAGSREGLGALHLGFHDESGALHYVGGVGTGFSRRELLSLRKQLDVLADKPPAKLNYAGEPPESAIAWVKPALVVEVQYPGWSGSGRLRHATYLGLREDKTPEDVVRPLPDPEAERKVMGRRLPATVKASRPRPRGIPPRRNPNQPGGIVVTRSHADAAEIADIRVTHPDRELWPGITKRDLAEYWVTMAEVALPGIAHRPLALVRTPEGIEGESFFQKHATPGQLPALRAGTSKGDPYLVLEDVQGLVACAQISAIELHSWGASLDDPDHADRLVFDLDPGEGTDFPQVVEAALMMRQRLKALELESFCRTTGGKGLHVVVPLAPEHDWDQVREFCHGLADAIVAENPTGYIAKVSKAARRGRILIDWLRNGRGATAVTSFSPRARPGATVATPLAWKEVTAKLSPAAFTLQTVPARVKAQRSDPWKGFDDMAQRLPAAARNRRR